MFPESDLTGQAGMLDDLDDDLKRSQAMTSSEMLNALGLARHIVSGCPNGPSCKMQDCVLARALLTINDELTELKHPSKQEPYAH